MTPDDDVRSSSLSVEAARKKYRLEREKRLRADGIAQYQDVDGPFATWLEDPYVEPGFHREPIDAESEVVIIGGGIGAIVAAAHLKAAGITDVRVVDKAADFGGAWYWNRYPGAMCDVESYIYLPLLEETGYVPTQKYATGTEIFEHLRRAATYLGLYERAVLRTSVTSAAWDETSGRWLVRTDRDDVLRARFLIIPTGQLLRPKLPGIPGVAGFKGKMFHTSRWDHEYTGGDVYGGLVNLQDKRVGIIGTGATAIQCIPHLGEWAKELFVFQRTPSAVDIRANRPTDQDWAASNTSGWQRRRRANFTSILAGQPVEADLVDDGWTAMFRDLTSANLLKEAPDLTSGQRAEILEVADLNVMDRIRRRVDEVVHDKATAELLKPWYGRWCKRPCFHDEYLPTFNLPNVTLVDTEGRGPDAVDESAVIVNGERYELDCLIFATGFEVGTSYSHRVGFDLVGQGGQRLSEKWLKGPQTLHGVQSSGFPNAFFTNTNHAPRTANYTHLADEQSRHIAYVISRAVGRGAEVIEVQVEAEIAWGAEVEKGASRGARYRANCTPGFYNGEGSSEGAATGIYAGTYTGGPAEFFGILEAWRAEDCLAGLDLRTAPLRNDVPSGAVGSPS